MMNKPALGETQFLLLYQQPNKQNADSTADRYVDLLHVYGA
ncbi:MAG: hypothetical protein V4445_00885 [Pseudomonadota bacterium]